MLRPSSQETCRPGPSLPLPPPSLGSQPPFHLDKACGDREGGMLVGYASVTLTRPVIEPRTERGCPASSLPMVGCPEIARGVRCFQYPNLIGFPLRAICRPPAPQSPHPRQRLSDSAMPASHIRRSGAMPVPASWHFAKHPAGVAKHPADVAQHPGAQRKGPGAACAPNRACTCSPSTHTNSLYFTPIQQGSTPGRVSECHSVRVNPSPASQPPSRRLIHAGALRQ